MARTPYRSSLKWLNRHAAPPPRGCDAPGCQGCGEYRAPKSRNQPGEYFWFCLDHVRDYNSRWDYFSGMSPWDIENHVRSAHTWDRPTWRMGSNPHAATDELREQVLRDFAEDHEAAAEYRRREQERQWRREHRQHSEAARVEIEALAVLDLEPPVEFEVIKTRYKQLVKKHHPDANGGDAQAEERLKVINEAYSVLKNAFAAVASVASAE